MSLRNPVHVHLENFEGPLDLLLHLIQSHELDITRVHLSQVTDQYLAYVKLMQELQFEVASDFLVIAATLIHWKSKSLLPEEKSEDQTNEEGEKILTEEELLLRLKLHQEFKRIAEELSLLPKLEEDFFVRTPTKLPVEKVWKEMKISDLVLTYQDHLQRSRKRKKILKKETVSISEKVRHFSRHLTVGQMERLSKLLSESPNRPEIVVTFLATLELSRLRKLKTFQEKEFDEIFLELLERIQENDFDLLTGFEQLQTNIHEETTEKPKELGA